METDSASVTVGRPGCWGPRGEEDGGPLPVDWCVSACVWDRAWRTVGLMERSEPTAQVQSDKKLLLHVAFLLWLCNKSVRWLRGLAPALTRI